jgi:hypothetical protein
MNNDWYVFSAQTCCVEIENLSESEASEIAADLRLIDPDGLWDYSENKNNQE